MAGPFAITVPSNALVLDGQRRGKTTFTVGNLSGRKLRGRAILAPDKPAAAAWLSLSGAAERDFPVAGSVQYQLSVAVPPNAPAGGYTFRLDMAEAANPDESFTRGPAVSFKVSGDRTRKTALIWILLAIIVVLILAFIVFLLISNR